MVRVALVTCEKPPERDPDQELLLDALLRRGVRAEMRAWDVEAPWDELDLAVLRSTWNYYRAVDRFLAWAERAASATTLLNPLPVVRWNAHKGYLRELERRGVPIVPTEWIGAGGGTVRAAMAALGAGTVVLKPAVSAASFETLKVDAANLEQAEAHARQIARRCEAMVQPYVASVEGYGERSLVCIDSVLEHAVRKSPRFGGGHEQVSEEALPIADDERALAERALGTISEALLYARIDVVRDEAGKPRVMELELIEPSLFLRQHPPALERFADAIVARVR